jgi:cytochrome c556
MEAFQLHSDDGRDMVFSQIEICDPQLAGRLLVGEDFALVAKRTLERRGMKSLSRLLVGMGILLGALAPAAQADDKDAVDYREHLMNTLHEQSEALGQILSGSIANDNAIAHLDEVALTATLVLKAFEAKAPGGEAKPNVWSNWPDFSKRMNEFAERTAAAAKAAHEHGADAGLAQLSDALTCKGCHEVYRQEKK